MAAIGVFREASVPISLPAYLEDTSGGLSALHLCETIFHQCGGTSERILIRSGYAHMRKPGSRKYPIVAIGETLEWFCGSVVLSL